MSDETKSPDDIILMHHPDIPEGEPAQTTRGALEGAWAEKGWKEWVDPDREIQPPALPTSAVPPATQEESKADSKPGR